MLLPPRRSYPSCSAEVNSEREAIEAAIEAASNRQNHIERWQTQKRTVLTLYQAFATQATILFPQVMRRNLYERLGLRVMLYGDREPQIEITLDPEALPPLGEATEAVDAAWRAAMQLDKVDTLEDIYVPGGPTAGSYLSPRRVREARMGTGIVLER